ncbi:RAS guanyl-releasing protein 4 isoform X2 [Rhinatrema bivittatum]|uniref:RAS guanyl-releasing protein 4 isoform X2 n=1 Tax=Rhinatrema bivittatum TaxID=194408 RepID=UPI00112BD816|nr:RAS guanyl-releasing protein 4 isoform X2 [Rhinatrema bivittatum]
MLELTVPQRYWITHYPEEFKTDPKLQEVTADFWEVVKGEGEASHCRLIDPSSVAVHDWTPGSMAHSTPNFNKKRKVSLLFDHLEPSELANHLSYLEFKSFCRISHLDYRSYVQQSSVRENPGLEHAVALCNSISQWVQVMILNRPTPQQRAEVFTKFIHVTQKLRQLQNFNTLMAVIGGLCHSAICRLKDTRAHLSHEVIKTLNDMTELLSSCSNYSTYRRIYSECEGFKIPILGVHLKDLVSLNEALPDYLEDNKINLSKLQSLYQHILELKQLQQASHTFEANKDVLHLLTLSLDLFYTEDEIYELSYAREPKTTKTLPSAPYKAPPVVVEWVSSMASKSDQVTLGQHVQETVTSIFENYDPEQSGYISMEDFAKSAAHFLLSFQGPEKDRKGPVSRDEITAYFMKAYSSLGLSFLGTTSKKPTLCICGSSSPFWGDAKQGYRSQTCEINCHKPYKDQLMAEYKKRFKVDHGSLPLGSLAPNPITADALKHTSSGSEEEASTFLHSPSSNRRFGNKERTVVTMGGSVQKSSICTRPVRTMHKETQTEGFAPPFTHKSSPSEALLSCQNPGIQQEQSSLVQTNSLKTSPSEDHLKQLKTLEKERDRLLLENASLHCSNSQLNVENARLQGQVCSLQEELGALKSQLQACSQPMVTFLLEDMDSLHLECDSKM